MLLTARIMGLFSPPFVYATWDQVQLQPYAYKSSVGFITVITTDTLLMWLCCELVCRMLGFRSYRITCRQSAKRHGWQHCSRPIQPFNVFICRLGCISFYTVVAIRICWKMFQLATTTGQRVCTVSSRVLGRCGSVHT